MGALHMGHLSLAQTSQKECDLSIVSIFVNPKQFNDPNDLIKYPRPLEGDISLLVRQKIDALFIPEVDEMYPVGEKTKPDFQPGPIAEVLEGKFRPGHFDGVAEVMFRLLSIIEPDRLYMGQKDFQQFAIVRKLITDLHLPVHLIMCPIYREENGLAMSSRNVRLSPQARKDAGIIYDTLFKAKIAFEEGDSILMIKERSMVSLTRKDFAPEYFEIVDGLNFETLHDNHESQFVVACCAVNVEGVRLIDNMIWTED
jgi:pantoate--beta-alanine ligase